MSRGPPASSNAPTTPRAARLDYSAPVYCLDEMCKPLEKISHGQRLALAMLSNVFVEVGIALAILTAIFHGVDPRTLFLIGEGLVFSWWICSTCTGIFRQELQRKYHLKNSPCDPFLVHCCLHWCANCQEHHERKGRLTDNSAVPMTIVNPPPVQEMSMAENHTSTSESEAPKAEHDDVEVIPL